MVIQAGFIGLGAMGVHMAAHLRQCGLLVAVANRTHVKAVELAQQWEVAAPDHLDELAARYRRFRFQSHYIYYTEEPAFVLIRAVIHCAQQIHPQLFEEGCTPSAHDPKRRSPSSP